MGRRWTIAEWSTEDRSGNLLLIAQSASGADRFDGVLIHALLVGGVVTGLLGLFGAAIAGADAVRRIDAVTDSNPAHRGWRSVAAAAGARQDW